jgi:hypothetical protein
VPTTAVCSFSEERLADVGCAQYSALRIIRVEGGEGMHG